jgi:hypothetical protein
MYRSHFCLPLRTFYVTEIVISNGLQIREQSRLRLYGCLNQYTYDVEKVAVIRQQADQRRMRND